MSSKIAIIGDMIAVEGVFGRELFRIAGIFALGSGILSFCC